MKDCNHILGICYACGGDFLLEASYLEKYPKYKDDECMDWFNYCPNCGDKLQKGRTMKEEHKADFKNSIIMALLNERAGRPVGDRQSTTDLLEEAEKLYQWVIKEGEEHEAKETDTVP